MLPISGKSDWGYLGMLHGFGMFWVIVAWIWVVKVGYVTFAWLYYQFLPR